MMFDHISHPRSILYNWIFPLSLTTFQRNLKMALSLLCSCLTPTRMRKSRLMSSLLCCARLWVCQISTWTCSLRKLMQMALVSSPSVSWFYIYGSLTSHCILQPFKLTAAYWDQMRTPLLFFFPLLLHPCFLRWVSSLCQDSSRVCQAFHHLPWDSEVPSDPGGRSRGFWVDWWDNFRRNKWREQHLRQEGGLKLKTIMTFS